MQLNDSQTSPRGRSLAIGFGTTTAMWAVAYLAMMEPGLVVGEALFVLTLACLVVGGYIAGRHAGASERGWVAGLKAGAVSGALNLLIVGSLAGGEDAQEKAFQLASWMLGTLAASIALGAIGGAISAKAMPRHIDWHFRFHCVAATTLFLLLMSGGLVTGLEAGLAVPDWPNSFGHNMLLYPLSEMIGGVYYEHAHRLYGMLVGVTAITVAGSAFAFDRRNWFRAVAVAYLLMVCVQGYMGGARVFEKSTTLAIIHGVFGQVVFATIVSIAAFSSPTWKSAQRPLIQPSAGVDRAASMFLTIMLVLQLCLGALYRHLQRAIDQPPEPFHVLYSHMVLAGLVTLVAVFAAGRAWGRHRQVPVLPAVGRTILIILGMQLTLGVLATIAVWSSQPDAAPHLLEVIVTTAHQATGALLLASSFLLMIWTRRLLAASPVEHPTNAQSAPAGAG